MEIRQQKGCVNNMNTLANSSLLFKLSRASSKLNVCLSVWFLFVFTLFIRTIICILLDMCWTCSHKKQNHLFPTFGGCLGCTLASAAVSGTTLLDEQLNCGDQGH